MGEVRCLFWNVRDLYPHVAGKRTAKAGYWPPTAEAYGGKVADVAGVLRTVPGGVPDLMAFCEVAAPSAAGGRDAVADLRDLLGGNLAHYTGQKGDSRGITCAAMWNTERLRRDAEEPEEHAVRSSSPVGEYGRRILEIGLAEVESGRPFTLFVNHWTSGRGEVADARRRCSGATLLTRVPEGPRQRGIPGGSHRLGPGSWGLQR
ncbi:MAG: hypothetical protein FJX75_10060 [Armatimonadetes bacterium]|nr:hypothetical protein [Armatimonadota bacterium]